MEHDVVHQHAQWHCIVLSARQVERGEAEELARLANEQYEAHDAPEGLALFATEVGAGDVATVYFSPRASVYLRRLLHAYNGQPCNRPADEALTVVAGDREAHELLE